MSRAELKNLLTSLGPTVTINASVKSGMDILAICSLKSCILSRVSHSIQFKWMKLLLENIKFSVSLLININCSGLTEKELRFLNKLQKPDTLFIEYKLLN